MRAVLQSAYTVTTGFGNLIDVILLSLLNGVFTSQVKIIDEAIFNHVFADIKRFDLQAHEFFLFASLMVLDMVLLAWMASRYKYVNYTGKQ